MVANDLLEELDLSKIPNFRNLETVYTNQPWDPDNKHSVCKDWGTTGWIFDKSQISRPINTWSDFLDVAMNEASGNVSLLDAQNEVMGMYFWANGIDWTTEDPADLDAYEAFMVNSSRRTSRRSTRTPGISSPQWELRPVARVERRRPARVQLVQGPEPVRLGPGRARRPSCGWTTGRIVKGAPHPEAAYAFINFILDPANSLQDLEFHGYNTGITGVKEAAAAANTPYMDMIFFTDASSPR